MEQEPIYDDTIPLEGIEAGGPRVTSARPPRTGAGRVFYAGLGVAASACDTAADRFDHFVDRGQRAQEEFQNRADEIRRQNAGTRNRTREYFRSAMDMFLDTFNVPSRTDVDTINVKLNILTRKIDDLQMQGGATPMPPAAGPAPKSEPPLTGDLAT